LQGRARLGPLAASNRPLAARMKEAAAGGTHRGCRCEPTPAASPLRPPQQHVRAEAQCGRPRAAGPGPVLRWVPRPRGGALNGGAELRQARFATGDTSSAREGPLRPWVRGRESTLGWVAFGTRPLRPAAEDGFGLRVGHAAGRRPCGKVGAARKRNCVRAPAGPRALCDQSSASSKPQGAAAPRCGLQSAPIGPHRRPFGQSRWHCACLRPRRVRQHADVWCRTPPPRSQQAAAAATVGAAPLGCSAGQTRRKEFLNGGKPARRARWWPGGQRPGSDRAGGAVSHGLFESNSCTS
jgi:hypothetical protein